MLLFNNYINRQLYMESPMAFSHLTFSDLESQSQGHCQSKYHRFRSLMSREGAQLGPMLLLNINRKPLWGVQ